MCVCVSEFDAVFLYSKHIKTRKKKRDVFLYLHW